MIAKAFGLVRVAVPDASTKDIIKGRSPSFMSFPASATAMVFSESPA